MPAVRLSLFKAALFISDFIIIIIVIGAEMDDGPSLCRTIKRPLTGRGRGHVTQFPNFGTLITFKRNKLSASNLVLRWRTDLPRVVTINDP